MGKRAARTAANGLIAAHLGASDHGVMLELACETDFVAKTEGFQSLAADVAAFVATQHPGDLDELLAAEYEAGRTVRELLDEANASMGEKIEIRRFERVEDGYVYVYLHKHDPALPPSVGALVQLDKEDEEVAKNVAQHIAAMAPDLPDRRRRACRRGGLRGAHRPGEGRRGGQAGGGPGQDRRGSGEGLLQGRLPGRAALGARQQGHHRGLPGPTTG